VYSGGVEQRLNHIRPAKSQPQVGKSIHDCTPHSTHEGESAKVSGGEQECGAQQKKAANLGME